VIELSIKALEETLESEDAGKIKARSQDLTEAAMKLGEAIYKAQAEENPQPAPDDGFGEEADDTPRSVDEDIVDADFEDLGDDKRS